MSRHENSDGRSDFDFLYGSWHIDNRRLTKVRDHDSDDWLEFGATLVARPVLGGLGNIDSFSSEEMPGVGTFEGMALRLFEPSTGLWRIWWASITNPGQMDPPVMGRFADGVGRFDCADELDGEPIMVRFEWSHITADSARWAQAFSYDEGQTWHTNWSQVLTRTA